MAAVLSATQPALAPGRVTQVENLSVRFSNAERTVDAVRSLSFHVDGGETLAGFQTLATTFEPRLDYRLTVAVGRRRASARS